MLKTDAVVEGFPDVTIEVAMLGSKLGRVVNAAMIFHNFTPRTVYAPVRSNDIVRLSHDPDESDDLPRVTEIVYKASPRFLSKIDCRSDKAMYQMIALAAVLGAEIQYISTDKASIPSIWLLHADNLDLPAIARAACISIPDDDKVRLVPALRCRIPLYNDDQSYLLIAIAVVLGADILADNKANFDPPDDAPNHITLRQQWGMDMLAIAKAAHVSEDLDDPPDIDLTRNYRPGPAPGPGWAAGRWGSINETPVEGEAEKQTDDNQVKDEADQM